MVFVKKKKVSNTKFYGIVALFILLVFVVEIIKNVGHSHVLDSSQDLMILPIFSIALVLVLAIPRKNL